MDLSKDLSFWEMPNGIRVVHLYDDSPVAYCGFAINVGTRDELPEESGMAHFIEHTLFKGTQKRKSWHIVNSLESVGGELNAYTTKEETFVYANFLCEDYEKAVDICSDIVFHATFPQKELDKEVDVIIDEIQSYKDTPSEQIYDDFEELVFANTPLGRNILGDAKRLKKYTTQDAINFVRRTYCTDKIVFFSLGKIPFSRVKRLAEKYLTDVQEKRSVITNVVRSSYEPFEKMVRKHTSQAHVMVGCPSYDLSDDRRLPMSLLNNIIGGPSLNSRLNLLLREKNGMAYNIESTYTSYSDSGLLSIYFGTEERNREKCTDLVYAELKRLREVPFTKIQLEKYKKQLIGQMTIMQENRENLVLSMAKSILYFNKFETLEYVYNQLGEVTPTVISEVMNDVLCADRLSMLVYQGKL
ncbi:MAG: insulinase family protein [Paludibacteraceae bacterium]|nr:insulinase family protein [Paludibacteraceae bacterium]